MYAKVPSCPTLDDVTRRDLAHRLFHLGSLNFSGVQLKTGEITPVYFDIRLTMSDPVLLQELSRYMFAMIGHATGDKFDLVTGVPAAAVGLATEVAVQNNIPMILTRKAAKDYGTKKVIEGIWKKGQNVLVIEDVVTYGDSIAETTALLRASGLKVEHALVVVERQQGATENLLKNHGVKLHALLTLDDLLDILAADGLVPPERVIVARDFISGAQYDRVKGKPSKFVPDFCPELRSRLAKIIHQKATNICLSVDVPTSTGSLLQLADEAGPGIAILEVNYDLLSDYRDFLPTKLRTLAEKHNFFLLADCKMAEDGWIAQLKLSDQTHLRLSEWADLISVHALPGPGALSALRSFNTSLTHKIGALIIYDMQTKGSLIDSHYQDQCVQMAQAYQDVVMGFVTSSPIDVIAHKLNVEGTPNVYYKTPAQHNHVGIANGSNDADKTVADIMKTFGACPEGVIRTVNLSSLDGNVNSLPTMAI
uniref:orotate phosphoribosyltransferase n=1 Tax=Mesocestoides corti TaxID=53468 RepID=A0A5K3ELD7_MESCO